MSWWFERVDYERRPARPGELSLGRMRDLLSRLGDPHDRLLIVHIAGSKGKGSTAAMMESIGREAGLRTGLYTSPHLVDIRERVQIAGEPISPTQTADLLSRIRLACHPSDPPTFFEISTALAYLAFAESKVEWAVIEVGLGGRFDATNVCTPAISIITSISLEHTAILGNRLDQIAFEKCGIIKRGIPSVSGASAPEAAWVVHRIAEDRHSPLTEVLPEGCPWHHSTPETADTVSRFRATPGRVSADGAITRPRVHLGNQDFEHSLLGTHQSANAALAIKSCEILARRVPSITDRAIRAGLANAVWPARMEVFSGPPLIILDCAHNGDSARVVRETLRESFPEGRVTLLHASAADKDVAAIYRKLLPSVDRLICTRFTRSPRAVPPADLAELAKTVRSDLEVAVVDDPIEALAAARRFPDMIVICGSVYLAGELRPALLEAR